MDPFLLCWMLVVMAEGLLAQYVGANLASLVPGTTTNLLILVGEWVTVTDPNPDSPRITGMGMEMKGTRHGQFLAFFQASMFVLHITHPPGSSITIWIDGKRSIIPFIPEAASTLQNMTYFNTGIASMSVIETQVAAGDHQLLVDVSSEQNLVTFDRIDMVVPETHVTPANYSIFASSVSAGDVADDTSGLILYSSSEWEHERNPLFWNSTSTVTTTPGAWMQVSLVGTSVGVCGAITPDGAVFQVEAVRKYGQEITTEVNTYNVTLPGLEVPIYQTPLFAEPSLTYSNMYTYRITLISGTLQIDYVRVVGKVVPLGFEQVGTTGPLASTGSSTSSFEFWRNTILIVCVPAMALFVGIVALLFKKPRFLRTRSKESDQEKTVDPFQQDSTGNSSRQTERTKALRLHTDSSGSPSGPPSLPSPSTTHLDTSYFTISISGVSNPANGVAGVAAGVSQEPSWLPSDSLEGARSLSLSHSDLAKLFRRAEQLRLCAGDSERVESGPDEEELQPVLENLARQLAVSQSSTGRNPPF